MAGLVSLVYGIIEVPAKGWSDPSIMGSLVTASVLLLAFVAWERDTAQLTARIGTRLVTATGLLVVAAGVASLATLGISSSDLHVAGVLFVTAAGMGLAMTPATDAIMAALPEAQLGVGSPVNDTTREIGGALGVAVLGSLFAGTYAGHLTGAVAGLRASAADAVKESLAGAAAVAQVVGGDAGAALLAAARHAFVDGMSVTAVLGAGFAVAWAVVALAFLPDRVTAPARGGAAPVPDHAAAAVEQAAA